MFEKEDALETVIQLTRIRLIRPLDNLVTGLLPDRVPSPADSSSSQPRSRYNREP